MWLFRTKDHAYYWESIEDMNSARKKELKTEIYDKLSNTLLSWQQAKPLNPKNNPPQSIPGYLGFLSTYDKNKSRQILLSQEDFIICKTIKCQDMKSGRLMVALSPVLIKEGNYAHKSEAEISAMTPAQRVDEYLKELYYHRGDGINNYTAGRDQRDVIFDYIIKDGIKALPALADIANRYHPENLDDYEKADEFVNAFYLVEQIDSNVIRIRATVEGRKAIKVFESVLNRMNKAGYANEKHSGNTEYISKLKILKILQGNSVSFRDLHIRETLFERYKIKMSDEELINFSNFLTSVDPTYPSRCKLTYPELKCVDSKEFYEAYIRFKAEAGFRLSHY